VTAAEDSYARMLGALEKDSFQDEVCARLATVIADFQRIPAKPHGDAGLDGLSHGQARAIERLMDEISVSDPDVQAYRQAWSGKLEDLFVQNLENVQGDERDIILISTVYGRTAEDVFHQNFGPINRAYGHRRLNVLFTRAKRRLRIFTSLDHSQIVADGKQRGVRVLKEFLEYATSGTIQPGRRTGEEPESDFERWFLQRLKSAGYVAHPQVGIASARTAVVERNCDRETSTSITSAHTVEGSNVFR